MIKRSLSVALATTTLMIGLALPAVAGHDHFVETPNGRCHQVAKGQTSIDDEQHGGYHRYHVNVHQGATTNGRDLGHGHSPVNIYKDSCP